MQNGWDRLRPSLTAQFTPDSAKPVKGLFSNGLKAQIGSGPPVELTMSRCYNGWLAAIAVDAQAEFSELAVNSELRLRDSVAQV